MNKIKTCLSNIAVISPRSIGYFIIVGGWEPIYQVLRWFKLVSDEFNGVFIAAGAVIAIVIFAFDYISLIIRAKRLNNK